MSETCIHTLFDGLTVLYIFIFIYSGFFLYFFKRFRKAHAWLATSFSCIRSNNKRQRDIFLRCISFQNGIMCSVKDKLFKKIVFTQESIMVFVTISCHFNSGLFGKCYLFKASHFILYSKVNVIAICQLSFEEISAIFEPIHWRYCNAERWAWPPSPHNRVKTKKIFWKASQTALVMLHVTVFWGFYILFLYLEVYGVLNHHHLLPSLSFN